MTPSFQGVYENDDVSVMCHSKTRTVWMKGDKVLKKKSNLYFEENSLYINKVRMDQRGLYICSGTDGDNNYFRANSTIEVGGKQELPTGINETEKAMCEVYIILVANLIDNTCLKSIHFYLYKFLF